MNLSARTNNQATRAPKRAKQCISFTVPSNHFKILETLDEGSTMLLVKRYSDSETFFVKTEKVTNDPTLVSEKIQDFRELQRFLKKSKIKDILTPTDVFVVEDTESESEVFVWKMFEGIEHILWNQYYTGAFRLKKKYVVRHFNETEMFLLSQSLVSSLVLLVSKGKIPSFHNFFVCLSEQQYKLYFDSFDDIKHNPVLSFVDFDKQSRRICIKKVIHKKASMPPRALEDFERKESTKRKQRREQMRSLKQVKLRKKRAHRVKSLRQGDPDPGLRPQVARFFHAARQVGMLGNAFTGDQDNQALVVATNKRLSGGDQFTGETQSILNPNPYFESPRVQDHHTQPQTQTQNNYADLEQIILNVQINEKIAKLPQPKEFTARVMKRYDYVKQRLESNLFSSFLVTRFNSLLDYCTVLIYGFLKDVVFAFYDIRVQSTDSLHTLYLNDKLDHFKNLLEMFFFMFRKTVQRSAPNLRKLASKPSQTREIVAKINPKIGDANNRGQLNKEPQMPPKSANQSDSQNTNQNTKRKVEQLNHQNLNISSEPRARSKPQNSPRKNSQKTANTEAYSNIPSSLRNFTSKPLDEIRNKKDALFGKLDFFFELCSRTIKGFMDREIEFPNVHWHYLQYPVFKYLKSLSLIYCESQVEDCQLFADLATRLQGLQSLSVLNLGFSG